MYKTVIFDLDGTLLDTTEGVLFAVNKTVEQLQLPSLDKTIVKLFVGPPMQESFAKHYSMNKEDAMQAATLFRKNYKEYSLFKASVYSGTMDILEYLKERGYLLAVATNKSHQNAMDILEHFHIMQYLDYAMGSDMGGKLTKTDIIMRCMEELHTFHKEAVYIGDSEYDAIGAGNCGMDFIAAMYGFGFRGKKDLEKYNYVNVITQIKDLNSIL